MNVPELRNPGRLLRRLALVACVAGAGIVAAPSAQAAAAVGEAASADAPMPVSAAARANAGVRAKTGLRRLERAVGRQSKALGKKGTRKLRRIALGAGRALRRGRPCRALGALKRFIGASKKLRGPRRRNAGLALGVRAKELQRLVLVGAARRTSCGLRRPRVRVKRGLEPARPGLGKGRPLARFQNRDGSTVDFVENELLVQSGSEKALDRFLRRWDGKRLRTTGTKGGPTVHLVRIKTGLARPKGLSADLRRIDPLSRGRVAVSSGDGLELLAAAADEAAKGLTIGINWIAEPQQFLDRVATEGASTATDWSTNPFDLRYMKYGDGLSIGVTDAWRDLEIAKRLGNRVRIGVIDGGFAPSTDFSGASTGADGVTNNIQCGGGNPCPWHGTGTASVAAGVADNSFGVAGTAGPIGDLRMIQQGDGMWDNIDAVYDAFENGARVINMSFGMEVDALVSFAMIPFEDATEEAREQGSLPFASAGNEGIDVDAEDCLVVCWEEEWHAPCENGGVICVGGTGGNGWYRAPNSNYGHEWCGKAPCEVDIFAPYTVFTGPDPANGSIRKVSGTSFSSPFAAGIAALIWAAKPSLSDGLVALTLLQQAHNSPDKSVARYVNARAAVRTAFGGNVAPFLTIDAPANGAKGGYGGFTSFAFKATTADVGDESCCVVTWSSNKDGVLGTGESLEHTFSTPGARTVTATATDSKGATSSASVKVTAENAPPAVQIQQPTVGQNLARGAVHKFQAGASDFNEPTFSCGSLEWTTWRFSGFLLVDGPSGSGCQPAFTFNANDEWFVRVKATDSQGATATATRSFDVVDPPAQPVVTILQPDDGVTLEPDVFYALKGVASEPNGDPIAYEWRVTSPGGGTKTIGTGANILWRPGDDVPSDCGGEIFELTLRATDPDGTGTDTINGRVDYPTC